MSSANILILDCPLIDYITATSWEREFVRYWTTKLRTNSREVREARIDQYHGHRYKTEHGDCFLGTGFQNGKENHMLHLPGYAGEDMKNQLLVQHRQGFVRITRLDLQMTCEVSERWSQWDLLVRLKEAGRLTRWEESRDRDGAHESVYVGSRTSNRMLRIYIKSLSPSRLLRFEVEYKKDRANAVFKQLSNECLYSPFLLHELQKTAANDKGLSAIFGRYLTGSPQSPKLVPNRSLDKTENWLIGQCLPAFTRVINDHNSSGRVLAAFMATIEERLNE